MISTHSIETAPPNHVVRFLSSADHVAFLSLLCLAWSRTVASGSFLQNRIISTTMASTNVETTCDDTAYLSDTSDLSSVPSRLSTPDADIADCTTTNRVDKANKDRTQLPTPPPSQDSSQTGSPSPDDASTMNSDKDGPPRKRRRVSERVPTPRTTEYLSISGGKYDSKQQTQADRLFNVLHKRQKIVVIAGAGISVSAGSKSILLSRP